MDPKNQPLLIHCNEVRSRKYLLSCFLLAFISTELTSHSSHRLQKGKHRTGCLIGCLRRVRGWALSSIFDEYLLHAQVM